MRVHDVFRVAIVAAIDPHYALYPLLGLSKKVITCPLLKEWLAVSGFPGRICLPREISA